MLHGHIGHLIYCHNIKKWNPLPQYRKLNATHADQLRTGTSYLDFLLQGILFKVSHSEQLKQTIVLALLLIKSSSWFHQNEAFSNVIIFLQTKCLCLVVYGSSSVICFSMVDFSLNRLFDISEYKWYCCISTWNNWILAFNRDFYLLLPH